MCFYSLSILFGFVTVPAKEYFAFCVVVSIEIYSDFKVGGFEPCLKHPQFINIAIIFPKCFSEVLSCHYKFTNTVKAPQYEVSSLKCLKKRDKLKRAVSSEACPLDGVQITGSSTDSIISWHEPV